MKSKKLLLMGVLITGCEQSPQSSGPNVSPVPIVAFLAKEDQGDSYENRQSTLLGVEAAILPSPSLSAPGDIIAYSVRSDFDGQLYEINLTTGVATAIGPTGFGDVEGLAFDPAGTILYAYDDASEQLLTCDLATGACTPVGPSGVNVVDVGLSFDDLGDLYMANDIPQTLYRINPATGAATAVGAQGQFVTGLAFGNGNLYGLGGDFTDNLVIMNRATGTATPVGIMGIGGVVDGGIDFDANGVLWGIEDGGRVFTINTTTGAGTVVFNVGLGFESLAIPGPGVIEIDIDIKPGSDPNSINCRQRNGVIPVAILSTAEFDATTVDHTTVTFVGASEAHLDATGVPRRHEEDVNGDGLIDLAFHFRFYQTGLTCGSTEGTLVGSTFDGQAVEGTDAVRMIDPLQNPGGTSN